MSKSTLTRRNLVAGAAAVPAFALPAVAGTAATPSLDELAALDRAAIVARAEQMVEVLRTCHVVDGWQLDEPRAVLFLDSLRRLDFNDGDTAEMTAVLAWARDHGQSLDWIFCGDPGGMVCRAAAQSAAAAVSLPAAAIEGAIDPTFAAIERCRRADLACDALDHTVAVVDETEIVHEFWNARSTFAKTVPTTPAGLVAFASYVNEAQKKICSADFSFPYFDRAADAEAFAATLDTAVRNIVAAPIQEAQARGD
jgi:hypothetical protein